MTRTTIHPALLLLALLLSSGCLPSSFEKARQKADAGMEADACRLYEQAILDGDHLLDAHLELARLCERIPNRLTLAWFHYEQALQLLPDDDARRKAIVTAKHDVMKAIHAQLEQAGFRESGDLRLKVNLLEEHARNLNRWLDELRQENRLLRLKLGEDAQP